MKIEKVEAIRLRAEIDPARQHRNDAGQVKAVETVLVRITAGGLVGYGESKSEGGVNDAVVTMIESVFAPRLIGRDAQAITGVWEALYNGSREGHARDRGHSFPLALVRRGLAVTAMAGIDMALWDLKGKALDAPVWQLIGGKVRDRLPAYASGGWADEAGIGDELRGYIDRHGFRAVKMRVGVADGPIAASVRRVEAARRAVGEEIGLAVDAHGGLTVAEAKAFSRRVRDLDLLWFEEPVSPNDIAGYRDVRTSTDVPIAGGERAVTRHEAFELLEARALDVLQPDLALCGGLTEALRITALASAFNVRVAPHVWGGCVLYAASLAFAAAMPNVFILEHCMAANPLLTELAANPFAVKDGSVEVRDAPGLGVDLDEAFIRRYAVPRP